MTISRGQTPRQLYGLGSFIKKITRPVKKVVSKAKDFVKSDLGKAALLGVGLYGLPGGFGGITGILPKTSPLRFGGLDAFLKKEGVQKIGGVLRDVAIGTGVAGLTDYFTRPEIDPSQERIMGRTQEELDEIEKDLRQNYENLGYSPGEIDLLVEQGMKEYGRDVSRVINAYGGRIGYSNGSEDYEKRFMELVDELTESGFSLEQAIEEARDRLSKDMADGGRIGYSEGMNMKMASAPDPMDSLNDMAQMLFGKNLDQLTDEEYIELLDAARDGASEGGRMGYAMGDTAEDNAMQASGVMGLPLNKNPAGVTELDLRETGGFIPPVGVKEKADDIPAMLSNNEFVFTADAVRGMGDGDVNKGAQRMYDMMKKLENGGRV